MDNMITKISKAMTEAVEEDEDLTYYLSDMHIQWKGFTTSTWMLWFCLEWPSCDIWILNEEGDEAFYIFKMAKGEKPDFENPWDQDCVSWNPADEVEIIDFIQELFRSFEI